MKSWILDLKKRFHQWQERRRTRFLNEVVAFQSMNGILELSVYLLDYRIARDQFAELLLQSEITWIWESQRVHEFIDEKYIIFNPENRDITLLDESTKTLLQDDLMEVNVDGYGRWMSLFGFHRDNACNSFTREGLSKCCDQFLEGNQEQLWVVIKVIGDIWPNKVYIHSKPHFQVEEFLFSIKIDLKTIRLVKKVKTLNARLL